MLGPGPAGELELAMEVGESVVVVTGVLGVHPASAAATKVAAVILTAVMVREGQRLLVHVVIHPLLQAASSRSDTGSGHCRAADQTDSEQ